tara:strand:+ start:1357 stop:2148 length:792 start_codon:yes stop_codon:yes gene_type:complete
MSSIYKKGRDGYYYYQAYIKNPKTGKKDKRVFHSLGTKVEKEAIEKKQFFDRKYEKNAKLNPLNKISEILKKNLKLFLIPIFLIVIIKNLFVHYENFEEISINETILKEKKQNLVKEQSSAFDETKSKIKKESLPEKILPLSIEESTVSEKIVNPTIPSYEIIRSEIIPDGFNQIKIFVIVEKSTTRAPLHFVCEEIKKQFDQYSSIIICIYANDKRGIEMANGNRESVNEEINQKSWMAMYSYHPVEGEYFDDNPGGYIGAY